MQRYLDSADALTLNEKPGTCERVCDEPTRIIDRRQHLYKQLVRRSKPSGFILGTVRNVGANVTKQ